MGSVKCHSYRYGCAINYGELVICTQPYKHICSWSPARAVILTDHQKGHDLMPFKSHLCNASSFVGSSSLHRCTALDAILKAIPQPEAIGNIPPEDVSPDQNGA